MKKLFAIMLAVVMVVSMVAVLAACDPNTEENVHVCKDVCYICWGCKTECEDPNCAKKCTNDHNLDNPTTVAEKVYYAGTLSLAELEALAQAEFEAYGGKFDAQASTSGVKKVLEKFQAKYTWFDYNTFGSLKDGALLTAVGTTLPEGNYWTDFALLQVGASVQSYVKNGLMSVYLPKADNEINVSRDAAGMVKALYADKLFVYNKSTYDMSLTNVWQLTGKDGVKGQKGVPAGLSFQDPTQEQINKAFLAMMTSSEVVSELKTAYKAYFGKNYKEQSAYDNIGYYFVSEFIANIKAQHGSDTTIAAETLPADTQGRVYVIGFNKMKSYPAGKTWQDEIFLSGVKNNAEDGDNHLEGFDGFTYGFYITIPKTTHMPYTACLFARYLMTNEGFNAGWSDPGYYPANTKATPKSGYVMSDNVIKEDPAYVARIQADFDMFLTNEMAK